MVVSGGVSRNTPPGGLERNVRELSRVLKIFYMLTGWFKNSSNLHFKICIFYYVQIILLEAQCAIHCSTEPPQIILSIKNKNLVIFLYFEGLVNDL